jgi:hypothetical protein
MRIKLLCFFMDINGIQVRIKLLCFFMDITGIQVRIKAPLCLLMDSSEDRSNQAPLPLIFMNVN